MLDRRCFVDIDMWMKAVSDHAQPDIIRFLVANKLDLVEQRTVATEAGEQKAMHYRAAYHEVSAVTARGIGDLFAEVPRAYIEKRLGRPPDTDEGELELDDRPKKGSKCC
jgi:Ras-related protein Rab-5C